jgi:hypothetical protein
MQRTKLETEANNFDVQLFILLDRARAFAKGDGVRFSRRERENWKEVVYALSNARPYVRGMMHKADREGTA